MSESLLTFAKRRRRELREKMGPMLQELEETERIIKRLGYHSGPKSRHAARGPNERPLVTREEHQRNVLEFLSSNNNGRTEFTVRDVAEALDAPPASIRTALVELAQHKRLTRTGKGTKLDPWRFRLIERESVAHAGEGVREGRIK